MCNLSPGIIPNLNQFSPVPHSIIHITTGNPFKELSLKTCSVHIQGHR